MGKISAAIVGSLILLSFIASAQTPSAPPQTSTTAQDHGPDASQTTAASGNRQAMTDIHDIKPLVPVPVPISWGVVALWTGICVAAGAMLLYGWRLWKRRRGPPVTDIAAMPSPEDTARQQLAALSAETPDGKAFYFRISAIFREYLQGRFGIDGLEMTTEELLPHVETLALERELKRDAKKFIISCDPVKFAGAPAQQAAMATDLGFVTAFVETTAAAFNDVNSTTGPISPDAPEEEHRVSI